MIRPAFGGWRNAIRCATLVLPAATLAGCDSREAEISERNQAIVEAASKAQETYNARQEEARAARVAQQEAYSQFYGHPEEGTDAKKKPAASARSSSDDEVSDEEPDFLDPTSDHFDNTYAVPEPAEEQAEADSIAPDEPADI